MLQKDIDLHVETKYSHKMQVVLQWSRMSVDVSYLCGELFKHELYRDRPPEVRHWCSWYLEL